MKKPISRKAHGFTDYSYAPVVAAAPALVGFKDQPEAVRLTRLFSGGIPASALLTRAEWGAVKLLPFKLQVVADTGVGACRSLAV